jgi:inorganic phosphate transporter, PiT family
MGTYMGGWRIIRTLGRRISHIETPQGFTAETTSATIFLSSTYLGLPLSTTQVCTGAIFDAGAGARRRLTPVRCSLAAAWRRRGSRPCLRRASWELPRLGSLLAASRRNPVTALNVNDVPISPPVRLAA